MIERRKFLNTAMYCSAGLMMGNGSVAFANAHDARFLNTCLCDLGEVNSAIQLQAVGGGGGEGDGDEGDDPETDITWQGVARRDLVWRARDVRMNSNGVMRIAVGFTHGADSAFRSEVIGRANNWLASGTLRNRVQFVFDRPLDECEIRVASGNAPRVASVNISLLGRLAKTRRLSARYDPQRISTMIISQVETTEHEFGHALGLGHEATHADVISQIDMRKAIAYYSQSPNDWLPSDTRRNFTATASCDGDREFNPASVMLYPLPSEITKFGQTLYSFSQIHERDRRCVESLYGV